MAHFAQLDEHNIVIQVLVVSNTDITNEQGNEDEQLGITFLQNLLGADTRWVQTSYNHRFRARYAGVGHTYDAERDVFLLPQPYPSWTLDETTYEWVPPVPYPADGNSYVWDESIGAWVLVFTVYST
jgi:hypothetical protein